jgi:hypothetical protein
LWYNAGVVVGDVYILTSSSAGQCGFTHPTAYVKIVKLRGAFVEVELMDNKLFHINAVYQKCSILEKDINDKILILTNLDLKAVDF